MKKALTNSASGCPKWHFFVYVTSSMLHKKMPLRAATEQGDIRQQEFFTGNFNNG